VKIAFELSWRTPLRWLLGLLLLWAALSKLGNLQEFYGELLSYRLLLPEFLLRLVAITLPWLELLCGLMLVANVFTRPVLAWAAALFIAFSLATGQAWLRGLDISCGCFNLSLLGLGSNAFFESVGFAFFRALLLASAAVYLLRQHTGIGKGI
jgi:uncharacterized membrane protein YphA (DoxX/SURF4 family)